MRMHYVAAFSGFSVKDLEKTKEFYENTLDLRVEEQKGMGLQIHLPTGAIVFVYYKENHTPATYTILNLIVENIDKAVDELSKRGVKFINYHMKEIPQDNKAIARGLSVGMGPDIAWFEDVSGNILSVLQEK